MAFTLADLEVVDDGEHVVDHAIPGEVHGRGVELSPWPRKSSAQLWATSARCAASGARIREPRGVAEQQRRTVAAEVDERERDTIGRGHLPDGGHAAMLAAAFARSPTGAG